MLDQCLLPLLTTLLLVLTVQASQVVFTDENGVKSAVFLSPMLVMGAGSVGNKFFHNIDFPRGHIALKEFNAEVVDEMGNSVPLHETYLHHWLLSRYYALTNDNGEELERISVRNSGTCQNTLGQYFGLGSETRQTSTYVPDPFGIEIGNPADIPEGYKERWYLNVHAIDTRGVEDRLGCTECRCDLYNITRDEINRPLKPGYIGGLYCCYDQTQCRLREGFKSVKRNLYLRYTVRWVDWVDTIVPVKVYILDVTDTGERPEKATNSVGFNAQQTGCKVEYEVKPCGVSGVSSNGCLDTKKANIVMPNGGYVVYGVAHQHTGGINSALYGEDGRTICSSISIYGEGKEAGNEAGYIVGMSTCYPQPGSVKISDGERLVLESNYSSSQMHTGVMGLFYLLVAEQLPNNVLLQAPVHENLKLSKYSWVLVFVGVAITFAAAVGYRWRNEREEGYQSLVM